MPVQTPLEARLQALLASAPPEYLAVYLFGSQARGTANAASDIDLAFWRATPSGPSLSEQPFDYALALSRALDREVQLIELNRADADLTHRVLRDGRLLLERDKSARIRFEVQARQRYFDMAPVRERYRAPRRSA